MDKLVNFVCRFHNGVTKMNKLVNSMSISRYKLNRTDLSISQAIPLNYVKECILPCSPPILVRLGKRPHCSVITLICDHYCVYNWVKKDRTSQARPVPYSPSAAQPGSPDLAMSFHCVHNVY